MALQPDCKDNKIKEGNPADLTLTGHEDDALFALATTKASPMVASGGSDNLVLLWNVGDYVTSLSGTKDGGEIKQADVTLAARSVLKGHTANIEDVVFEPESDSKLASVGDDHAMLIWDTSAGFKPVQRVDSAHGKSNDVQCVDWCQLGKTRLVTGSNNGTVNVWDVRKLAKPTHVFSTHSKEVLRVEWSPLVDGLFASSSADRCVMVFQLDNESLPQGPEQVPEEVKDLPDELLFNHMVHKGEVVDFQWHPTDPYSMLSVSHEVETKIGGGTLHQWRISDLIYRPVQEVVSELKTHEEYILRGKKPHRHSERVQRYKGQKSQAAEVVKKESKKRKQSDKDDYEDKLENDKVEDTTEQGDQQKDSDEIGMQQEDQPQEQQEDKQQEEEPQHQQQEQQQDIDMELGGEENKEDQQQMEVDYVQQDDGQQADEQQAAQQLEQKMDEQQGEEDIYGGQETQPQIEEQAEGQEKDQVQAQEGNKEQQQDEEQQQQQDEGEGVKAEEDAQQEGQEQIQDEDTAMQALQNKDGEGAMQADLEEVFDDMELQASAERDDNQAIS